MELLCRDPFSLGTLLYLTRSTTSVSSILNGSLGRGVVSVHPLVDQE
jgi:hypothetical protein